MVLFHCTLKGKELFFLFSKRITAYIISKLEQWDPNLILDDTMKYKA